MRLTIDLKNYINTASVFKRSAARGIIKSGDLYLMIHSKYGDYKFPGGGVQSGEDYTQAMIREVREETGYRVIPSSILRYGSVFERRKGEYDDILEMNSHYFICDVEDKAGQRNLDENEAEYDYQVIWITLEEAVRSNKRVVDLCACPWVVRDTKVMELLMKHSVKTSGFPSEVKDFIHSQPLTQKRIGHSGNKVYQIGKEHYLKISGNLTALQREKGIYEWVKGRLSAPEVVLYAEGDGLGYLITTRVPGKPACSRQYLKQPYKLCRLLNEGLKLLKQVDIKDCPYYVGDLIPEINNPVFVHGDYCLPNILIRYGKVSGFVDLGEAGAGDPWQDYAWCLWSLEYNLKIKDYFGIMLKEIGIEFDEDKYNQITCFYN